MNPQSNLTERESEAICRCYNEFFKDSQDVNASLARVALVFQVSTRTVQRILNRKRLGKPLQLKKYKQTVADVGYGFKELLNSLIFSKIKKNEHFTIQTIFEHVKENLDFPYSKTTLFNVIKSIGYRFKKVDRRKVLIERPQIITARIKFCWEYLHYLKEYEKGNLMFVYLDETWVYQNGNQIRQWCLESTSKGLPSVFKNEGKRYTIVNAGCQRGFLIGCDLILDSKINDRDYHKTMNGDIFKKWVTQQLIPALHSLNSKCVVVMDNAPYHSMKVQKPPSLSSKKEELIRWMTCHNLPFDSNSTKLQLWESIKPRLEQINIKYEIDEILKAEGHEVLRLPPYNCQYNPIELAWADCKTFYNKHISAQLSSKDRVMSIWKAAIYQCSEDKWKNFISHAEEEIKIDWQKFMGVKSVDDVPPFIINLNSDSSESESENEDICESDYETDSTSEEIILMVD